MTAIYYAFRRCGKEAGWYAVAAFLLGGIWMSVVQSAL